jgi:hypothetical protein
MSPGVSVTDVVSFESDARVMSPPQQHLDAPQPIDAGYA